jgi:hypothetical protein
MPRFIASNGCSTPAVRFIILSRLGHHGNNWYHLVGGKLDTRANLCQAAGRGSWQARWRVASPRPGRHGSLLDLPRDVAFQMLGFSYRSCIDEGEPERQGRKIFPLIQISRLYQLSNPSLLFLLIRVATIHNKLDLNLLVTNYDLFLIRN